MGRCREGEKERGGMEVRHMEGGKEREEGGRRRGEEGVRDGGRDRKGKRE